MKLGVDLVAAGYCPVYEPTAVVGSEFPINREAGTTQRTRWEHGHLITIVEEFPKLVAISIKRLRYDILIFALDLAVPPLSILLCANLLLTFLLLILCLVFGSAWLAPLSIAMSATMLIAASTFWAWLHVGKSLISWRDIPGVLVAVLSKQGVFVKFLFRRQSAWVRTRRADE